MEKQSKVTKSQEICLKHNKSPYKYICVSPSCNFFVPLCDSCLEDHKILHYSEYEDPHPMIRNLVDFRSELSQIIDKTRLSLDVMLQQTQELIILKDDTILNHINNELDAIQNTIKVHFDLLKKEIKKTYEEKLRDINDEIRKYYYDLREALDFCLKYINKPIALDSIKTLFVLDLPYQVAYKQEKQIILTEKKNNMSFAAEISKEFSDKFFATFDSALNELVAYENSPYRRPQQALDMSGVADKFTFSHLSKKRPMNNNKEDSMFEIAPDFLTNENKRKWLFYFEENTKNFFYLDIVRSKSKNFEKIMLNIPFNIFPNHRCLMATDGEIYLLGGYNGHINEENEGDYLHIYRFDHHNKTLIPLEKMNTLRHSFGVCCIRNKIYAVGGANYREGALIKCENYDIKTHKWTRNNFLNIRSLNHCLAVYKDTHIFKFGGLRKKFSNLKELSLDLFERYDINLDLWEKMKLKDNSNHTPAITYLSGCYAINENSIFVFGGKNEKNEPVKQTFLINFRNDVGFCDKVEENLFSIMEVNTKALPFGIYFISPMAVVSGKTMYCSGFFGEKERKVLSFDQKMWKNFIN